MQKIIPRDYESFFMGGDYANYILLERPVIGLDFGIQVIFDYRKPDNQEIAPPDRYFALLTVAGGCLLIVGSRDKFAQETFEDERWITRDTQEAVSLFTKLCGLPEGSRGGDLYNLMLNEL